MVAKYLAACAIAVLLWGCTASAPVSPTAPGIAANASASKRWIPAPGQTYQIQYDGKLDLSVPADVYDLDVFDTPKSVVAKLHKMGRRVVC
jgi:Glycoside-hydrolase family GH114